ncbi:MAG: NAD-dependent epimerase/dehydratase family protein [Phycisphaerales bacterium JB039]
MPVDRHTILITGGCGMIGSALARRLADDYHIVLFDIKEPSADAAERADFIYCDITSDASVHDAVRRLPDSLASVLHLAAYYDFAGEPSPLYDQVTVKGTGRLLDTLRLEQKLVDQFIFSSTMLVHKPTRPGQPINEDDPLEGRWDYPKSKIRTEQLIRRQRAEIPAVLLRIAGVYTDRCDSIPIAHQIQRIRERRLTAHVFPGDTSHGQAFVHLDDLVDAFAQAVERRAELPEEIPILIGEPATYSYQQLQRAIAKLVHNEDDWLTEQIPKAVARSGAWVQDRIPGVEEPFIKPWMVDVADDHYQLDITRARTRLDWKPRRDLVQQLPVMIDHLEDDPEMWYRRNGLKLHAEARH